MIKTTCDKGNICFKQNAYLYGRFKIQCLYIAVGSKTK